MHLDVGTLSVVTVFVTALLGSLLVFAGLQTRHIRALRWWGAAQILGSFGLGLLALRGKAPDLLVIELGNAVVLLAYGLLWAGARLFDGRRVLLPAIVLAPIVWLLACRLPIFAHGVNLRIVVQSGLAAALTIATAGEIWRGRAEPLMSRKPAVVVLLGYSALVLGRIPATYVSPFLDAGQLLDGPVFALLAFAGLLFTLVMSFLLLNLTKERTELQHKINASVDPLSGVANRRAFLEGGRALVAQQAREHAPVAVLLFDLDRFKEINDHMGHAAGDRVLQTFAASATSTLGTDALLGRIGGEEFAALTPVGDMGEAYAIADRVRRNFAAASAQYAHGDLRPSVSVGVTLGIDDEQADLDRLLEEADLALYRAKANGRNRVETSASQETGSEVIAPPIVPLISPARPHKPDRQTFRRVAY
ncbi:MAG: GGDEF domain-containing protein [Hyphomicrobiales bacterium]|nr:GGDEF domain-containing protein [Hyphomicrobiales bacterium]